jgi:lipoprotein NlpD
MRAFACHRLLPPLALALLLGACGGETPKAPVKEQRIATREPEAPTREVRAGDTLYSIAWESGRDYRELAAWNDIAPPYVIRAGQALRLYPPKTARPATPESKPPASAAKPESAREKTARKKAAAKPETAKLENAPGKTVATKFGPWAWPSDGTLIERFGPTKGIGIAGQKGQPVLAAAPGTVVYRGSGLRGYGELIIVKHDADFLSAYAHNGRILVKEGNGIRRGQKIAEMGSSGTDRVKLHFEIRYRGTPVDPIAYLPKK